MRLASLASHWHVARTALAARFSPVGAALGRALVTAEITAEITEGLQAGVSRDLRVSQLVIGSGPDCDIVLLEEGIAALHVEITFQQSFFGGMAALTAMGDSVFVNGTPLHPGHEVDTVTFPFALNIGTARIDFSRPGLVASSAIKAARNPRLARVDPVLVFAALALLLTLGGSLLWDLLTGTRNFVVETNRAPVVLPASAPTAPLWPAVLEEQITARGLGDALQVETREDQILRLSGAVPETRLPAYRALQNWYSAQPDAPAVLWDVARMPKLRQLPDIGLVRLTAPPAVVLTSGQVINLGEEVTEGWRLERITETQLTLARGDERQTIVYQSQTEEPKP